MTNHAESQNKNNVSVLRRPRTPSDSMQEKYTKFLRFVHLTCDMPTFNMSDALKMFQVNQNVTTGIKRLGFATSERRSDDGRRTSWQWLQREPDAEMAAELMAWIREYTTGGQAQVKDESAAQPELAALERSVSDRLDAIEACLAKLIGMWE